VVGWLLHPARPDINTAMASITKTACPRFFKFLFLRLFTLSADWQLSFDKLSPSVIID
jgi:hypothetical protein